MRQEEIDAAKFGAVGIGQPTDAGPRPDRLPSDAAMEAACDSLKGDHPNVGYFALMLAIRCAYAVDFPRAAAVPAAPAGPSDDRRWARIAALEPGWDSYGSPAISPAAIQRAKDWLAAVIPVPMSDGGVQLEVHRDGYDVEIAFSADGSVEALAEPASRPGAASPPAGERERALREAAEAICPACRAGLALKPSDEAGDTIKPPILVHVGDYGVVRGRCEAEAIHLLAALPAAGPAGGPEEPLRLFVEFVAKQSCSRYFSPGGYASGEECGHCTSCRARAALRAVVPDAPGGEPYEHPMVMEDAGEAVLRGEMQWPEADAPDGETAKDVEQRWCEAIAAESAEVIQRVTARVLAARPPQGTEDGR